MGVIRSAFVFFFLLAVIPAVFAQTTTPDSGKNVAATPAAPKTDQELLNNKFEKMQKMLLQEEAPAEAKAKDPAYKPTNSKDVLVLSFKIMMYLAILSALLYFGIKAFKKGSLGRSLTTHHKSIEILESVHLAQNKTVNLVQILDRVLVLGVTESAVNLLTIIEDEASVKRIRSNNRETASTVAGNFSASVNGFLDKFKKENRGVPLSAYRQTDGEEQ